jgi:hypothetical protein
MTQANLRQAEAGALADRAQDLPGPLALHLARSGLGRGRGLCLGLGHQ